MPTTLARQMMVGAIALLTTAAAGAQTHDHAQSANATFGTAHLATSCAASTAPAFDHALAALHSFEFGTAISGFSSVLASDSSCAMAYWGIALSRWSNPMAAAPRSAAVLAAGRQAAAAGARLAIHATERERGYVAAVSRLYEDYERVSQTTRVTNYERAMAELVAKQPADTEAKIFHAIALVAAASPTDKTYAYQLRAGATLESLWVRQPDHPGLAHYIIHAYDVAALAPRAAAAAAKYAAIAPSAAHALHMPSHTFTRRGQWDESIETNRRSIDAARRAGGIGEALHASDYAIYALLQEARDAEARALVDSAAALAPQLDANAVVGAAPGEAGVFALAAIPARYAIERRDWRRALALTAPKNAELFPWTSAMIHFSQALAAAHLRDTIRARIAIDSLAAISSRLQSSGNAYWAEQVAIQQLGASAWLQLADQRADSALALMRTAAAREDATEKSAVTPGPLAPAHELFGDMLMELHRPKTALAEYEATLVKEPNRFRALYGAMQAATETGDMATAAKYREMLRTLCAKANRSERPELRQIFAAGST